MSGPATSQTQPAVNDGRPSRVAKFEAMNTLVTIQVVGPTPGVDQALAAAEQVFRRVEESCTRFDPESPLMKANRAGADWNAVPSECYLALSEAARAYQETRGLFDPRVLESLVALGYDRTFPFRTGSAERAAPSKLAATRSQVAPWQPSFDATGSRVRLGPRPVDLGGIGKGVAVRLASEVLAAAGRAHVVEAGGDCHLRGGGLDGAGWKVGVEDPMGGADPIAVLKLRDVGCATSSIRYRNWKVGDEDAHHLIDPRTGSSAKGGVRSVTVVGPDTARDEVWSKALLIAGKDQVGPLADRHGLAALWVEDDGRVGLSSAMSPWIMWLKGGGQGTGSQPALLGNLDVAELAPHLRTALEDRAAMLRLLARMMQMGQSTKRFPVRI